jgi:cytochrome c oxidase subunit 1
MHILGVGGHMRRIHDPNVYDFLKPFQPWNEFITIMAIILGFSQLILFGNIIYTWIWGPKAPKNPWNANTLEWHAPSPPPHGNFLAPVRVYRSPYEFSHPDRADDFHPQWLAPGEVEIEETTTVSETQNTH